MNGKATRPKLIFLVTEDWYFWAHRLPQAQAALASGFDVGVATRVQHHGERIRAAGFALHALDWERRAGPFALLAAVFDTARLYRRERPALVHHVALKPVLIGSMAAALARVPFVVNAVTGLGYLFVAAGVRARLMRKILLVALRLLGRRPGVTWLVQNPDDGALLAARRVAPAERIALIRGSGIDLTRYRPLPDPAGPVVVIACATRLLRIKGVGDLVAAFRLLRARGSEVRLLIAGEPDPENPSAIPEAEILGWATEPGIEWLGRVEDVRELWIQAHIATLPSWGGEGIPMTLLEAAACGRPLIATDVPGCREIAHQGINALLVPVGAIDALADAMERLASDAALRVRFGKASRQLVESDLSAEQVGAHTAALYRKLLAGRA
jgi:glycosyltransferase involved in cell wall biosynthesis